MTSTELSPVTFERRFIAFLDILGFSNALETRSLAELHETYGRLIDEARSRIFEQDAGSPEKQKNFDKAQFLFDSIVLVSGVLDEAEGPVNAANFINAVCLLFEEGLTSGLPLRGCIGLGDLLDDSRRGIFLSPIFPALVKSEKEQEWSGIAVLPAAADELMLQLFGAKALPAALGSSPLLRYPIPVKDRAAEQAWALNWVDFIDPPKVASGLEHVIQPKRTNTKAFVDHVASLPRLEGQLGPEMAPAKRVRVQFSQRVF